MPRSGKRVYEGKHTNETHHRSPQPYFAPLGGPMQDLHSGTITRAYCRAIYEESVSRCFILPPLAGEVRRSPDRGVSAEGR